MTVTMKRTLGYWHVTANGATVYRGPSITFATYHAWKAVRAAHG